jgi:hypothetical protein
MRQAGQRAGETLSVRTKLMRHRPGRLRFLNRRRLTAHALLPRPLVHRLLLYQPSDASPEDRYRQAVSRTSTTASPNVDLPARIQSRGAFGAGGDHRHRRGGDAPAFISSPRGRPVVWYRSDMRVLAWIALLVSLSACAPAKTDRDAALLKDARECEAHADAQLRAAGQEDPGLRFLIVQSCMSLLGWGSE